MTPVERVLARVEVGDCWLWQGYVRPQGYGTITTRQGGVRTQYVHRVVYEALVGPAPDTLDHLCRVRHCVNPDHLEPVTLRENLQRSPVTPGGHNRSKTECQHGHPFTPENTYTDKRGRRHCRECRQAASQRHRRRERSTP